MKRVYCCALCSLIVLTLIFSFGCSKTGIQSNKGTEKVSDRSFPAALKDPNVSIVFWEGFEKEWFYEPIKLFEQKYGGKVNIVETLWAEMKTKIIAMVNAGEAPDIVFWNNTHMPTYAISGIIQPLDEYVDIKDSVWDDVRHVMDQFKYKGKYYGVATFPQIYFVYYNKTMFENNGIKTPIEYYKEGKWDWNTFIEVATKLTQDIDRNGQIDQWGASLDVDTSIYANGGDFVVYEDDGGIRLTLNDSRVVEGLQFIQDAVEKYKYMPAKTSKTAFEDGKLGMTVNRATYFLQGDRRGKMKDEYGIVPFPKAPSVSKPLYAANAPHWGLANGTNNPEGAAVLLYLRQKNENENNSTYLKGAFNDEEVALLIEIAKSSRVKRYEGIGNMRDKYYQMINQNILMGKPVLNVIEQYIPLFQAEIDMMVSELKP